MRKTETQINEATKVNQMIAPWLAVDTERMAWTVLLTGGVEITIYCPLGAAVEVEEAGHIIRAAGH